MSNKPFNGHPSWNAWNVSLWINNDEGLYREALHCIDRTPGGRKAAALAMLMRLHNVGSYNTPDGAPWTVTNIMRAMKEM